MVLEFTRITAIAPIAQQQLGGTSLRPYKQENVNTLPNSKFNI
jgi:hypothetical protein